MKPCGSFFKTETVSSGSVDINTYYMIPIYKHLTCFYSEGQGFMIS